MSLPPALLARLAQRGLVNKQKVQKENEPPVPPSHAADNEEVIAEDYDEMDTTDHGPQNSDDYQYPSQYDLDHDTVRKPVEENNWLAQMKTRMGEANSAAGYRCCPNKYNIWHKCTVYCVNRWSEGIPRPSAEYMKRYKRLIRKYPLPKGWVEMYDPGCGCYYFACEADNVVSWLPPTHPKSEVTKCAAAVRKQMEESSGEGGNAVDSDAEEQSDTEGDNGARESAQSRHHREVDEIITASMRSKSPRSIDAHEFPSLQEVAESPSVPLARKQKSRDLDRVGRQRRDRDHRGGDRDRERDRERDRDRDRYSHDSRRRQRDDADPMDPSSYSDAPRGKWSDGLQTGGGDADERKKRSGDDLKRNKRRDVRDRDNNSDEDEEDDYY
ncbi:poly-glutamine tract binding protein 1 [Musca autumnalis]|uniref:poly-glutamine tract binding protein 1 n=1 Tax=Musca autumnalis TaxID=221902 RepID=UPI003CEC8884